MRTEPIASPEELQELLTEIVRGAPIGGIERPASITERLKAVDLLGKSFGLWSGERRPPPPDIEFVGDELLTD